MATKVTLASKGDVAVMPQENLHLKHPKKVSKEVKGMKDKMDVKDEKEKKDTKAYEGMLEKWDDEVAWELRCVLGFVEIYNLVPLL